MKLRLIFIIAAFIGAAVAQGPSSIPGGSSGGGGAPTGPCGGDLSGTEPSCQIDAWFNLKTYGGDPTGVANSTAALTTAITAAPTGGTIFVPCGTFLIDPTFTISKAITVQGQNACSILKYRGTGSTDLFNVAAAGVVFSNIVIDGNSHGGKLIQVASATVGFTITDSSLKSSSGACLDVVNSSSITVKRNLFTSCGATVPELSYGATGGGTSLRVVITDNVFTVGPIPSYYAMGGGGDNTSTMSGLLISRNVINFANDASNETGAIYVVGNGASSTLGVTVTDNQITGTGTSNLGVGIEDSGTDSMLVSNNIVINAHTSISLINCTTCVNGVNIANNVIRWTTDLTSTGIIVNGGKSFNVHGNVISIPAGGNYTGLQASTATDGIFADNFVTGATTGESTGFTGATMTNVAIRNNSFTHLHNALYFNNSNGTNVFVSGTTCYDIGITCYDGINETGVLITTDTPTFTLTTGKIISGTYTSGITATGTAGQSCFIWQINSQGGSNGQGIVLLTGTNTIAGGTAIAFTGAGTSAGSGYAASPTSAPSLSNTATCSGTATMTTILQVADTGAFIQNSYLPGVSSEVLPVAQAGMQRNYTSQAGVSSAVTIAVATGNTIALKGVNGTTTTGTLVSAGAAGDSISLVADAANHWTATVQSGTWTNN